MDNVAITFGWIAGFQRTKIPKCIRGKLEFVSSLKLLYSYPERYQIFLKTCVLLYGIKILDHS